METEIMDEKTVGTTAIATQKVNPAMLVTMAIEQGADLDRLERLMNLQDRWERNEARKAYTEDMARFKSEPLIVTKDKQNSQYKSSYVSIGNLFNTVMPKLSKYGFSSNFEIDQSNSISVTCIITHKMGHSDRVTMTAPPDGSGSKNPIQQIKSTLTYLRAATFEAAIGIAASDANVDDDGNGAGKGNDKISVDQRTEILDLVDEVKVDLSAFLKFFKIQDIEQLPAAKYQQALIMLRKKREAK